ncbi:MAG: hypothetical protein CVU39_21290 [Chloroflexi bacterium HGW-Chloroflexi-10]|nr:MAG: hypothetical protein CVU39_21290 [Chloroflexi bacterium HGW-Chloroflexi-10]
MLDVVFCYNRNQRVENTVLSIKVVSMKKILLLKLSLFGMIVAMFGVFTQPAAAETGNEPYSGSPLCLPGVYQNYVPVECLPLGPSSFLTTMAEKGIPVPMRPLPAFAPDANLAYSEYLYIQVGDNAFPLYGSLDDAIARSATNTMEAGFKFLSYINKVDSDNGIYYQLSSGYWVEAGEAVTSRCCTSGRFQGLMFYQNPTNDFGWIVDAADVLIAPGYASESTGISLQRETVVQIYDMVNQDGTDWYMVGWDQWVERRKIRQFHVNLTPPDGVDNGRWIEVNLYEQTLGIYENGHLVFATMIASGMEPFYTRPGLFQIYEKLEKTDMSGSFEADRSDYYHLENVPNTLYYDDARALHGAYWRTMFGYPQSHGCVNISIGDSKIVFDWANVGDWVYVWDPTGQTPTDESFYKSGGF